MKDNKEIIIYLLIIFLIIIGILSTLISLKKETITIESNQKKSKKLKGDITKIKYFNEEYINRYIKYQNKYKNLSLEEIVTRVNIGIDKKEYKYIKESPYKNKNYILINKYIYLNKDYVPENLEYLDRSYARENMMLVKSAKNNLEKMIADAKKENITIRVMSSYRSYYYQVNLYNNYVKEDGKLKADTYSARPGFSEHQTGLCIDIDDNKLNYTDFEKTQSYKWMQNNSYKYGFIERYPKNKEEITKYQYESWHYRYVGKKIAKYIKKHNITLDEYYVKFIENQEE